ncbi:MAG: ABC transporter permease [Christensenellales bacterium]
MQLTQTVSMAFKAISGNKVRAFLTMLGVIIGVMSVIVLIAIGQGTTASVTESISSMGTNLLTVSIQTRRVVHWACRVDSADLAAAVPPRARSF